MSWTSGYVADIDYTYGYYPELNPTNAKFVLNMKGLKAPDIKNACELGFGQGISLSFHAAATDVNWFGTDFNPNQALFARELNELAGTNTLLSDRSFEEYCSDESLPQFDFIGLHGIWSWVSDKNRKVIIDFIDQKLAVGGILYLGYNTQPGWASMLPLRDLMVYNSKKDNSDIVNKINQSIDFAEEFFQTEPSFAKANPHAVERLKLIKDQNRNYLAHEYFNQDWTPMLFSEISELLSSAKLSFAGSANYLDLVPSVNFNDQQREFMSRIKDPILRELIKDFYLNQGFRKDYWMKGSRKLSSSEFEQALNNYFLILVQPAKEIEMKVKGNIGEADLSHGIYPSLINELDLGKKSSLATICKKLEKQFSRANIFEAIFVLLSKGSLLVTEGSQSFDSACNKLNNFIIDQASDRGDMNFLVSPVTRSGVRVGRIEQLIIATMRSGSTKVDEICDQILKSLSNRGEKLLKDGKVLETHQENLDELKLQCDAFLNSRIHLIRNLKIMEK